MLEKKIFHQMALIFPQVPIIFTLSIFENKNAMYQLFGNG